MLIELLPQLFSGLITTVTLTLGAGLVGLTLSMIAGVGRIAHNRWLVRAARTYVEFFRGTSALIQLYWAYFVLPLFGVRLDAMTVGICVLGLNAGAYGAEVVRGAILAVPRGQWEAAQVLGLGWRFTMFQIVVPQALPRALPPLNNVMIELLKNTSLVSLITLADLTFEAQALRAATLRTVEIFGALLAFYLVMALGITAVFRRLERAAQQRLATTTVRT